jgi:integrase/recombinase XerD
MHLLDKWKFGVGKIIQRIYAATTDKHWLIGEKTMAQAKTLNEKELNLLLLYIKTRKYAVRDRAMVLMTYWGGMRIGEVASTKIGDVLNADGTIKEEIRLTAEQTKGKHARTVVLAEKLRKEILAYIKTRFTDKELIAVTYSAYMNKPLFATQKREGFNANTACYHFHMLYKGCGLNGASSHSGRRSYITSLSARAVPLKVLMELVGHRQAQTTMRYIDVTSDMKRAAVELV